MKKLALILGLVCMSWTLTRQQTITIMLSPSGDSHNRERSTPDGDERGVSRQLAEELAQEIQQWGRTQGIPLQVHFTHRLGESITQQEKANFANRLGTTIYLALCCHTGPELCISLYQCAHHTPLKSLKSSMCPYNLAYTENYKRTSDSLTIFHKGLLTPETLKVTSVRDPIAVPVANLKGITAPAICIDVALKRPHDWQHYVTPLCAALSGLCGEMTQ